METVDLDVTNSFPHKSIANLVEYGDQPAPQSRFQVAIGTNFTEYKKLSAQDLFVPLSRDTLRGLPSQTNDAAQIILDGLANNPEMSIYFDVHNGRNHISIETHFGRSTSIALNANTESGLALRAAISDANESIRNGSISNFGGIGNILSNVADKYKSRIYRFSAQRLPAAKSSTSGKPLLEKTAGNLPYCINHLSSNDAEGHRMLCNWVHRIFPSVKWIQSPPITDQKAFELQCLPEPPEARRNDLAVPLDRMGSGIGNVIAILYVVLTARHPKVIAIDEPNSFLHPKALRELLSILAHEGKEHQYILTGHSPDVLTAVAPSSISMFELQGTFSVTKQVSGADFPKLRNELAELGIRMTDLHGRDRILWVEGQTEEIVIPALLDEFCSEISAGTAVLRVEHTGSFDKKRSISPQEVANIYKRLSESSALVPPMVAILLDKEERKSADCERISRESQGKLLFLERRMLENYGLVADAIAAILSAHGENIPIEAVAEELDSAIEDCATDVNGAEILSNIFSKLSETRLEFKKTRDMPMIFTWLIKNQPDSLSDLRSFLRKIFDLKQDSQ